MKRSARGWVGLAAAAWCATAFGCGGSVEPTRSSERSGEPAPGAATATEQSGVATSPGSAAPGSSAGSAAPASTAPASTAPASTAPASTARRPGAALDITAASAAASDVFVGRFVALGREDLGAPGQSYWDGAEVEIRRPLRGKLSGHVPVVYTVQALPPSIAEIAPIPGEDLVMFVATDGGARRVIKMLPASPENIALAESAHPTR